MSIFVFPPRSPGVSGQLPGCRSRLHVDVLRTARLHSTTTQPLPTHTYCNMAPSQMKALVAAAEHTTEVKTISVPKPGAGEVLIKVRRAEAAAGVQALTSHA